jgi:spore germination protein Q
MNGSYYQNPMFNNDLSGRPADTFIPPNNNASLPMEQSYVENILRLNKGKKATAFVSFPDSINWKDKMFTGIIEQAGRDHLIMSDPSTGKWYLILMIYLDYVEFDEKIKYGL